MDLSRITLFLTLGATLAAADPEPDKADKKKAPAVLEATVTVTAEATAVEAVKTPNPVKIVPLERIEASGAANLGDLLNQVLPGQLVRLGGPGAGSTLFLNGTRSKDVVVTLDGLPLRDTSTSGVDFTSIPMAGIERLEVLTGSCSVLAGADATGGVVALYSGGPAPKGTHGSLSLGLGNQGRRQGDASVSHGTETAWVRAGGQLQQEQAPTETRNPFQQSTGYLGAGLQLNEDHNLAFSYRNGYVRRPLPYMSAHPTKANSYDESRESSGHIQAGSLRLNGVLGSDWSYEVLVGGDTQHRLEVGTEKAPATPYDSRRSVGIANTQYQKETWGLAFQSQYEKEQARTAAWPTGQNEGDATRRSLSAEGNLTPVSWLRGVVSLRRQWDDQGFIPKGGTSSRTNSSSTVGKIGVNVLLENGFRAYTSYGTSYGLPFLSQVLYNLSVAQDQEALRDEKSHTTMAGIGYRTGAWTFSLDLNRSAYQRLVYFDGNVGFFANGANLRIQGAEFRTEFRQEGIHLTAFVRSQEARDMKAPQDKQLATSEVVRRPFLTGGLQGTATQGAWTFEGRWTYSGKYYDLIPYPSVRPSRTHFNDLALGVRYACSSALSLGLKGENLMQPRLSKADWLAKKTDFQNDAYRAYNFPAQAPVLTLEARYRF